MVSEDRERAVMVATKRVVPQEFVQKKEYAEGILKDVGMEAGKGIGPKTVEKVLKERGWSKVYISSKDEIMDYVHQKGGDITPEDLLEDRLGDYGMGTKTVSKIRDLVDEGRLARVSPVDPETDVETTHFVTGGEK